MTLINEDRGWRGDSRAVALVRRAAQAGLALGGRRARPCTLLLAGDSQLRELNRLFRGKNVATNVLSFPSPQPDHLGDIAIAYGVAVREARAQGKTLAHHAAHLALHGVLHLFGYEHGNEKEAAVMERMEGRILARLGVPNPYVISEAA
jgi:probable rRNA maturation factor